MDLVRLIAVSLIASVASAQKSPDIQISSPSSWNNVGPPVIDSEGDRVYVAWTEYRAGLFNVFFRRSIDRGNTWQPDVVISPSSGPFGLVTMHADAGRVYAAWTDGSPNVVLLNRSLDAGTTWLGSEVRIDADPSNSAFSFDIASSGDHVYVAYTSRRDGLRDVYFNRSMDGGLTWMSTDVKIDNNAPGTTPSSYPIICAQGSNVYVAWSELEFNPSLQTAYVNRSTDGGQTWLPAAVAVSTVKIDSDPDGMRMAAEGDDVWVVFGTGVDNDIRVNRSSDGGATWAGEVIVGNGNDPEIAVDGQHVHVAWTGILNSFPIFVGAVYTVSSLDGGATFSDPARIDRGESIYGAPHDAEIAASGSHVGVLWHEPRTGLDDLHFSRSTDFGATWPPFDIRLDRGTGNYSSRFAKLDAAGSSFYALWEDRRVPGGGVVFNVPFGIQPYGAGTAGTGGLVPAMADSGFATLGSTVVLDLRNGLGNAPGAWLLGVAKTSTPFAGGTLLVVPTVTVPLVLGGAGATGLPLNLPTDPAFLGGAVYFQGVVVDPGAPQGLSMSDARELWIG